ncbi:hypothetical protein SAMN05192588_0987 [Nonlabens sp. Hel1_33_55]|uniref:hypothetical protein n=1 Tax=Nonlabens sp. Hel1_33_55 TaxID=1336802 RepID=UPI000875C655|nr:hypothetical protein [Nonlabens sp. Hel1_33_55]SCY07040.1 hypothetical protein SAMN05192588_0987 [Nonlabens sp. Hel1_33_55]
MEFSLSIEDNPEFFSDKMITFEKRRILQHYFESNIKINDKERNILEKCPANEIEPIALIGYLLGTTTPLNVFRLRIGSVFKSDLRLAKECQQLFTEDDVKHAESVLYHWEYEYDEDVEEPIVHYYNSYF